MRRCAFALFLRWFPFAEGLRLDQSQFVDQALPFQLQRAQTFENHAPSARLHTYPARLRDCSCSHVSLNHARCGVRFAQPGNVPMNARTAENKPFSSKPRFCSVHIAIDVSPYEGVQLFADSQGQETQPASHCHWFHLSRWRANGGRATRDSGTQNPLRTVY